MSANVEITDTFDQWRVKSNEWLSMIYPAGSDNFIKLNNSIKPFKLRKKSVINLLSADKNSISRLEIYVNAKRLSYKKEKDVIQILDYAFNL